MKPVAPALPYPVVVEDALLDRVGELVARSAPAHAYAVISDENVGRLYGARVLRSFGDGRASLFTMVAGEPFKTVASWAELCESMLKAGFGRDSTAVALGGGIVGDVAGFVAATFMRGIPYVQVPTTVVAMVDSAIGGKTGVNTPSGKNLLGAFHQPSAVLSDPKVLATLPPRELRAGLAEVLKHGIIADSAYFGLVCDNMDDILASNGAMPLMREIISRSVEIKGHVVMQDEREAGLRKILNFGHTIGHAIEALSNYSMLHGEAIAIGMCVESAIAERTGAADGGMSGIISRALERAGLPTRRPVQMSAASILDAAATDKKVRRGEIELALPSGIGSMAGSGSDWSIRVPRAEILAALE